MKISEKIARNKKAVKMCENVIVFCVCAFIVFGLYLCIPHAEHYALFQVGLVCTICGAFMATANGLDTIRQNDKLEEHLSRDDDVDVEPYLSQGQ